MKFLLRRYFPPGLALFAMVIAPGRAAEAGTASLGETQFLSNARQLTFEGKRSGEGYFSPDGKALIFQSEREPANPFYQIYLLDLESGDCHRVSPGAGKTTCAFFRPNSDEVLFASTHLDPETAARQKAEWDFRASGQQRRYAWDYDEQMDIFSARHDGTALRRLTATPGYDAEGAWSPDGKQIVYCSLRDAYPRNRLSIEDLKRLETDPAYFGEIYLMNADGSNPRRLTRSPGYDGGPFFSPDGQRILWRHFDAQGNADVYTMQLDGSDVKRLTDFGAMSWAPYFHPSGQYIIFTCNKLGFANFELYLVEASGEREPVRVTTTDGFDGLPVFAPDGRRLCWTSSRTADGKSQLFLGDWNHEAALAALRQAGPRGLADPGAPPSPGPAASSTSELTVKDLRLHVQYLASEALEGRMTGSTGAQAAANYIAAELRRGGLAGGGAGGDYFQPFDFNAGVRVVTNENQLALSFTDGTASPGSFKVGNDFNPLSFTANAVAEGDVVFVGYGLAVPGSKPNEGYDSYAGVDDR